MQPLNMQLAIQVIQINLSTTEKTKPPTHDNACLYCLYSMLLGEGLAIWMTCA